MYSRNNSIVFITIAFFAFVLLFVHAADVRTTGPIVKIKSLDDVSDHNVTKMIEDVSIKTQMKPEQIKKIVSLNIKEHEKVEQASISLFELILFKNKKVKETMPEKSCFKYNLAALGFALNSFADTINSLEHVNGKNALPDEVVFSFQANGIPIPDVVKTNFHPPEERVSFIELSEKFAGESILMRPDTLNVEGYVNAIKQIVTRLTKIHENAQGSMACNFGSLKSFAKQRRCWQLLKESKNIVKRLGELEKDVTNAMKTTPLIENKGSMYCKVPVQWNNVLKTNANSLMTITQCNLQKYRKEECDTPYKSWFGMTKKCRDPKKLNLNGGANGIVITDLIKIFPTLMEPTRVANPKMEIENLETTFLSSKDMRLDTYGDGSATLFYNCGGVCWARCLSSLDCLKGESVIINVHDMDHIDKQIRAKIKVTVSNANYLIEDLSHELKQLKIQPIDSKGSKDNSTVSERRELEEKMNKRLNFKNKNLKGQS